MLVVRSITTYLLPCFGVYVARVGSSFLSNVLCCLCKCFGCWRWVDGEFEGDSALGLPAADAKDIKWVRARELSVAKQAKGGMKLFRGIEPNDVCQGALGDCWLVGAMAGLAEYPAAVRNCFVNVEASELGKYKLRLWCGRAERWEIVTVDDSFPVKKNQTGDGYHTAFMHPNGGELWAILMEKAFAKFHGSYGALKGGFAAYAWHTMTGDYVFQFHHDRQAKMWRRKDLVFGGKDVGGVKDRTNHWFGASKVADADVDDEEAFFGVMLQYSHKRSLMGAFFHVKGGGEHRQDNGLVAGHLYSVLDVRRAGTMMGMGGGHKLVKLRNPWARGEWRGAWSDGSKEWSKHPAIAHEVEYTDANDGSFWMSYEDFSNVFTAVEVCDRTTKNDLCLDVGEGDGCLGPTAGCVAGCAGFWCLCRGARTIYFGNATSDKTESKAGCCVTK